VAASTRKNFSPYSPAGARGVDELAPEDQARYLNSPEVKFSGVEDRRTHDEASKHPSRAGSAPRARKQVTK
jgi:hypothetical protein